MDARLSATNLKGRGINLAARLGTTILPVKVSSLSTSCSPLSWRIINRGSTCCRKKIGRVQERRWSSSPAISRKMNAINKHGRPIIPSRSSNKSFSSVQPEQAVDGVESSDGNDPSFRFNSDIRLPKWIAFLFPYSCIVVLGWNNAWTN